MAPIWRNSRSISFPRAARVVPSGQGGAGAARATSGSHSRSRRQASTALLDSGHLEVVVTPGGGQRPGLGLDGLGGRPSGRLLAPLLVLGGLERRQRDLDLPAAGGFGPGLGGEGGGVLFEGGRRRLGLGPLGPEPFGGHRHGGLAGPVRVEGPVARRLPPPGLIEGGAGLG